MMTNSLVAQTTVTDSDLLADALRKLTDQKSTPNAELVPVTQTNPVEVTQTALTALEDLSVALKTVQVPSDRRLMTPEEQFDTAELAIIAKKATKAVDTAVSSVKEALFNHFDVALEEMDESEELLADYPVDKAGAHYLVGQELYVPGVNKRLVRQLAEKAPTIQPQDLKSLYESGAITRAEYHQMTSNIPKVRPVNQDGVMALIKSKPEILAKLASAITPGDVSARFVILDPKRS
jgi:hypothetical protein